MTWRIGRAPNRKRTALQRAAARVAGSDGGEAFFGVFDRSARSAVVAAEADAKALGHPAIGPEHFVLALFRDPTELATRALIDHGVTQASMKGALAELAPGAGRVDGEPEHLRFTPQSRELLIAARAVAVGLDHDEVTSAHILMAALRQPSSLVSSSLIALGADPAMIDETVRARLSER